MPSFYRAALEALTSARANHDPTHQRFSSVPTTNKPTANNLRSASSRPTNKPAANPFSFNNYAFKPAPQPSATPLPFDPAELTRKLERYLASLDPNAAAATNNTSNNASAATATQQHGPAHLKPQQQRSQPRSATASAQSPASPNPAAANSRYHAPNRVSAAARSATDPLSATSGSQRPDDWAALDSLRREARRAQRRSMALHGNGKLNAPVEAGELAKRLSALNGDGAAMVGLLRMQKSLPDLKRASSARANEKRPVVRREGSKRREAGANDEREKAARRSSAMRRSTVHGASGKDVEMWRVFVETQNAMTSNSQAVAHHTPVPERRKSRRPRPLSTTELDLDRSVWSPPGSAKLLQKSRSSGFMEAGSSSDGKSGSSKSEVVIGRRPDWSQRDEEREKEGRLSPLHLHVPGFGRRSSTSITEVTLSEDERALSDVEGKRQSSAKTNNNIKDSRKSICVAEVNITKKQSPQKRQPSMLQIPPNNITTTVKASSSASPSFSHSPTSPPSITLSPVDPRLSLDLHPGFSPNLSPLQQQPPSPYETRVPHAAPLDRKPTQPKPTLAPLPEVPPLPAPDRYSKTRPKSFVAPARSSSTPAISTSSKAQDVPPVAAPTNVPWPGPQSRSASGGPLSSNPVGGRSLSLFPAEDERMKKRKSVAFAEHMELGSRGEREGEKRGQQSGGTRAMAIAAAQEFKRPSTSYHPPSKKEGGNSRNVRVKEREVVERGGGVMSPTRLVFWRRDSGVASGKGAADETLNVSSGDEPVVRSPSRLAFWKKRATSAAA